MRDKLVGSVKIRIKESQWGHLCPSVLHITFCVAVQQSSTIYVYHFFRTTLHLKITHLSTCTFVRNGVVSNVYALYPTQSFSFRVQWYVDCSSVHSGMHFGPYLKLFSVHIYKVFRTGFLGTNSAVHSEKFRELSCLQCLSWGGRGTPRMQRFIHP